MLVEIVHLFLDGTVDAGISRMQADDEFAFIIEFLHQCKLFFQVHGSRTAYRSTRFGTECKFAGNETAGVEDKICLLQHLPSAHGDEVGITRTCADDFDMSVVTEYSFFDGYGHGVVSAFLLVQQKFTTVRGKKGGGFGNAGRTHMLLYYRTGVGDGDFFQFLRTVIAYLIGTFQLLNDRFVAFLVNGGDVLYGTGHEGTVNHRTKDVFNDVMHGTCLMCQTYADMQYLGHIKECRGVMRIVQERSDEYNQLVTAEVYIPE